MTSHAHRMSQARRKSARAAIRLTAALTASMTVTVLASGVAAAAPNCAEGYAAIEIGGRAATGDLTLSGNYGGPPEMGGGSFGQGIVGFDVGVRVQEGGGMANVNPPPPVLPPSMIPPESRADQLRQVELTNSYRRLDSEYRMSLQQHGAKDPNTQELQRRLQVVQDQIAEMSRRRSEEIDEFARRQGAEDQAEKAKGPRSEPCEGLVVGARGRLPVGDKETSRHNIHPLPSLPTSVFYDATMLLTVYVGYMMLLDAHFLPEHPAVAVTPWAGVTVERGKLGMTTDELGTVSSFSEGVTRTGPSLGVNVDVPLTDDMFIGLGLQGDFLSGASATGTSPLFTYNYGRDKSFEYSGFARLGIRW